MPKYKSAVKKTAKKVTKKSHKKTAAKAAKRATKAATTKMVKKMPLNKMKMHIKKMMDASFQSLATKLKGTGHTLKALSAKTSSCS
jgi:hypothetical protein